MINDSEFSFQHALHIIQENQNKLPSYRVVQYTRRLESELSKSRTCSTQQPCYELPQIHRATDRARIGNR